VAPLVEKAKAVAGDAARWFNFFDKLFLLALLYFEEKKVTQVAPRFVAPIANAGFRRCINSPRADRART
jgi:aspartate 1-decarboxylase